MTAKGPMYSAYMYCLAWNFKIFGSNIEKKNLDFRLIGKKIKIKAEKKTGKFGNNKPRFLKGNSGL